MSEMFKIFLDNLQGQVVKFNNIIFKLQDCTIDKVGKLTEEGDNCYSESIRIVS